MISEYFRSIQEENRFTMAANGYTIYLTGIDHDDNYTSKTYVYNDKIDFMAALASLEDIDVD